VVEIRHIVACTECRLYWDEDSEQAKCQHGDHEHRVFEVHRHLTSVVLPDGTRLTAASFDPVAPYSRPSQPDYGLYWPVSPRMRRPRAVFAGGGRCWVRTNVG
jgi:hypothetical protein